MKKQHEFVKETLFNCISEMDSCRGLYAKKPKQDFTRNRKLSFQTLVTFLLHMGGNSTRKELFEYFDFDVDTVSPSAFVQQREKLLPCALEYLFHEFTNSFTHNRTYKGYRLFAIDGSSIAVPHNSNDKDTYFKQGENKGSNLLHLNAMYDLYNQIYTDALIQPRRKMDEYDAFAKMVDRFNTAQKAIFIADRGYESYNLFAHVEQKGLDYLIRVKDITSNGMLSSFDLPDTDEFDVKLHIILTRKQTKKVKANPKLYKFLPTNSRFDFLDLHHDRYYPISLRVLRLKINDNLYETIITNLDSEQFSPCDIKELYALRWGIETSFRKLKYTVGLLNFHSKKDSLHYARDIFQTCYVQFLRDNYCACDYCCEVEKIRL